jgi:putative nucleotidyltransferase with HDIG domain
MFNGAIAMVPFLPYLPQNLHQLIGTQPRSLIQHSRAVACLAGDLAKVAGCNPIEQDRVRLGSLLHDIGKQFLPASILEKQGKLTDVEYQRVQQHALLGHSYLSSFVSDPTVLNTVLYHHECWNGSGYPFGLKNDQIPRGARICALADVWDALVTERCYRAAWSQSQAIEYIWVRAGSLYDPKLACLFLNMMEARDRQERGLSGLETPSVPVPLSDISTMQRTALSGQIRAVS